MVTQYPDQRPLEITAGFRAVGDVTRRAILDLLREGAQPAGEIARVFPVSRPAISRHLRVLRQSGLVGERREGRSRIYELQPGPLQHMDEWLETYRQFWARKLVQLKKFVESQEGEGVKPRGRRTRGRRRRPGGGNFPT